MHLLPDDLPEPSWLDLLLPPSHEEHANRRERECDTQSLMSVPASPLREDLNVPDRFEGLADVGSGALRMRDTVGRYLAFIRRELLDNGARIRQLLVTEQYRMWTAVIAGNDPEGDVAALTRGGFAYADIDRLMTATGANIVKELKRQPDRVGILATMLDARIVHTDMVTILAVARQFGDEELHELMRSAGMSTQPDDTALDRVGTSELGLILAGNTLGTRKRGSKPGGGTQQAFQSLAGIARTNDGAINRALGAALVRAGLVDAFEAERDLGTELTYVSDLYLVKGGDPIRLEIMWRSKAGRADIANYVLGKLGNYGHAIGLLD